MNRTRKKREMKKVDTFQSKTKNVYALPPYDDYWTNQMLLKDCGIVPYLLHKKYGYNAIMVGWKNGEYPYLDTYLKGLQMEFLKECKGVRESVGELIRYVEMNSREMDILTLYGAHSSYFPVISFYRKLRPDGKIYMALDANTYWTGRIAWSNAEASHFFDICDVLATSGKKMQQYIAMKWPKWKIEYIPNGFFNSTAESIVVDEKQKENILLTVGRIGTEQKANHVLLEAFAAVSEHIGEWKVHLVGAIDEQFKSYVHEYFKRYPHLREKVLFKGLLESKEELYHEYARAKIFILTSNLEGGTPNVFAEALFHGCYMITSEIDAAEDITNKGACGRTFPIGDSFALQQLLVDVCNNDALLKGALPGILRYAENTFDWDTNIQKIHYLLHEPKEKQKGGRKDEYISK